MARARLVKGSPEAKAYMAKLRRLATAKRHGKTRSGEHYKKCPLCRITYLGTPAMHKHECPSQGAKLYKENPLTDTESAKSLKMARFLGGRRPRSSSRHTEASGVAIGTALTVLRHGSQRAGRAAGRILRSHGITNPRARRNFPMPNPRGSAVDNPRATEVADAFAKGEKHAVASNFYVHGNTIYSYGPHFPIAEWRGDKVIFTSRKSPSVTTSKHMTYVRRALSARGIEPIIGDLQMESSGSGRYLDPHDPRSPLQHVPRPNPRRPHGFYVMGRYTSASWWPTRAEAEAEVKRLNYRGGSVYRVEQAHTNPRYAGAHKAFDVFLRGKEIDTVFWVPSATADEVKRSLVGHDGYDPNIEVVERRGSRRSNPLTRGESAKEVRVIRESLSDMARTQREGGKGTFALGYAHGVAGVVGRRGTRDASRVAERAIRHLRYNPPRAGKPSTHFEVRHWWGKGVNDYDLVADPSARGMKTKFATIEEANRVMREIGAEDMEDSGGYGVVQVSKGVRKNFPMPNPSGKAGGGYKFFGHVSELWVSSVAPRWEQEKIRFRVDGHGQTSDVYVHKADFDRAITVAERRTSENPRPSCNPACKNPRHGHGRARRNVGQAPTYENGRKLGLVHGRSGKPLSYMDARELALDVANDNKIWFGTMEQAVEFEKGFAAGYEAAQGRRSAKKNPLLQMVSLAGMNPRRNPSVSDISQWIDNDEGLYNWWRSSRMSKTAFIRANKAELDAAINAYLNRGPKEKTWRDYAGTNPRRGIPSTEYSLTSTPMIHTPGVFNYLRQGYRTSGSTSEKDKFVNVLVQGYKITPEIAEGLLDGSIPYKVKGESVVFVAATSTKVKRNPVLRPGPSLARFSAVSRSRRNPVPMPNPVAPPFKNGQRIPVEKARAWVRSTGNKELARQLEEAIKLGSKANKEPDSITWVTVAIGSKSKIDMVTAMAHYGDSPETYYVPPKGSKKDDKTLYRHKWGEGGGGKGSVPLLAAAGGKALLMPLTGKKVANDWLRH